MTDNESIVHKIFEAINRRDLDGMRKYLADDMTCILPDGTRMVKKGVHKDFISNLAVFLGMRMHVDLMVSEGNKVVVRWTGTGTNKTAEMSGVWIFGFETGKVKLLERL